MVEQTRSHSGSKHPLPCHKASNIIPSCNQRARSNFSFKAAFNNILIVFPCPALTAGGGRGKRGKRPSPVVTYWSETGVMGEKTLWGLICYNYCFILMHFSTSISHSLQDAAFQVRKRIYPHDPTKKQKKNKKSLLNLIPWIHYVTPNTLRLSEYLNKKI